MPYVTFLDTHSAPRSGIYRRVFRTQTEAETTGAVLWGQAMSMTLMSLALTFEVTLRNRIHVSLSRQASTKAGEPPTDSYAWYDNKRGWHKLEGETYEKVEDILSGPTGGRLTPQPTPDYVISRLSFGVWPNILDAQLPTPAIEMKTFSDVFPHHPKAKQHWRYQANCKSALQVVRDVQKWRNRIAHCKPVWTEGWYRSSQHQHWTEVTNRLKSRRAEVLEVLRWACPQTAQVHEASFAGRLFNELISDDAVLAHLQSPELPALGPNFAKAAAHDMNNYKARV